MDRVLEIVNARNGKIAFAYDAAGRLTARTDEREQHTRFTHTPIGRVATQDRSRRRAHYLRLRPGRGAERDGGPARQAHDHQARQAGPARDDRIRRGHGGQLAMEKPAGHHRLGDGFSR